MWDTETKSVVTQYHEHLASINDLKFNSDGTYLASCSQDRKVKVYDVRSKRQIQHYDAHGDNIFRIDFHPKGNYLISSSADSKTKVFIF
jgi:centriolar protein POC1